MSIHCVICGGDAPDGSHQVVLKAEKPNKGHDLIAEAMCYDCLFALRNAVVNGSLKFFLGTGEGSEAPEAPPPKWDRSINIENDVDNTNLDAVLVEGSGDATQTHVKLEVNDRNEHMQYHRGLTMSDADDLGDFLQLHVLEKKLVKWEPRAAYVHHGMMVDFEIYAGMNTFAFVFNCQRPNQAFVKFYEMQAQQFWNWLKALPGI